MPCARFLAFSMPCTVSALGYCSIWLGGYAILTLRKRAEVHDETSGTNIGLAVFIFGPRSSLGDCRRLRSLRLYPPAVSGGMQALLRSFERLDHVQERQYVRPKK